MTTETNRSWKETEAEQLKKGAEQVLRLYPEYDRFWDGYEWDEMAEYELSWPEYDHFWLHPKEIEQREEKEWTDWMRKKETNNAL
mgnify:CR=1 FL=1|tara:strand:+ start:170 stop:424 length:255 start_codon:yes stop_codon:yes gene_type:complete